MIDIDFDGKLSTKAIFCFRGKADFLSNMYTNLETPITLAADDFCGKIEGFQSSENAYMASKAMTLSERKKIRNMAPKEAKEYCQEPYFIQNHHRTDITETHKITTMKNILSQKFCWELNPSLSEKLVATNQSLLIEGNIWQDTFWGFCLYEGYGLNHLGRLLMQRRTLLKNLQEKE